MADTSFLAPQNLVTTDIFLEEFVKTEHLYSDTLSSPKLIAAGLSEEKIERQAAIKWLDRTFVYGTYMKEHNDYLAVVENIMTSDATDKHKQESLLNFINEKEEIVAKYRKQYDSPFNAPYETAIALSPGDWGTIRMQSRADFLQALKTIIHDSDTLNDGMTTFIQEGQNLKTLHASKISLKNIKVPE